MLASQLSLRCGARFSAALAQLAQLTNKPTHRRFPRRIIALAMTIWFTRRRRMHAFGYLGHLPYALPAMALTAMLV